MLLPAPTVELPSLEELGVPVIGDALPRVRDALGTVANVGRDRLTLVLIMAVVLMVSGLVFLYLMLRRR